MESLRDRKKKLPFLIAALWLLYSVFVSFDTLTPFEWTISFLTLLVTIAVFSTLGNRSSGTEKKDRLLIAGSYLLIAFAVFYPTLTNLFRSDYWLLYNTFLSIDSFTSENLKSIALFEIVGDLRFQPLAHLLIYLRHLLLGESFLAFHILNILLHVGGGYLLFSLILRLTGEARLAYLGGAIFLVLQSQFDTVIWTYHIYIICGLLTLLASLHFTFEYSDKGGNKTLYLALTLALLSLLLYEPAILFPGAIGLLIFVRTRGDKIAAALSRKNFAIIIGLTLAVYIFYLCLSLYGLSLTAGNNRIGAGELLEWSNIERAFKGLLANLYQSSILKNIGITARLNITDILYIHLPADLLREPVNILKILCALTLLPFIRLPQKARFFILVILAMALSYIFIISMGRVRSNTINYLITQPRYQYLPNALFILAGCALLYEKFKGSGRNIITTALLLIFFWNFQNTLIGNKSIDANMAFLDKHYYEARKFLDDNPHTKLYVNFIPSNTDNDSVFVLGADIALDLLLGEELTSFPERARHIYTKDGFMKNPYYKEAKPSPQLGDFYISWDYRRYRELPPLKDVVIIGSLAALPKISIKAGGYVTITAAEAGTGAVETISLKHPYSITGPRPYRANNGEASMALLKSGDDICLFFNNEPMSKAKLTKLYSGWDLDGKELLGDHFRGKGGPSRIVRLFKQMSLSKVKCP